MMEWISVKDRLPEKHGDYLVYGKFYDGETRGATMIRRFYPNYYGNGSHWKNVTHWMPLPDAPEVTK